MRIDLSSHSSAAPIMSHFSLVSGMYWALLSEYSILYIPLNWSAVTPQMVTVKLKRPIFKTV